MADAFEVFENIKARLPFEVELAIVLGSGLGDFADGIEDKTELPYSEIKDFPVSTVPGHAGKFIFGNMEGKKIVAMQGRVHYYEGYSMEQVVLPIKLMKLMGAKKLILTNAAGGINYDFCPGDFMIIKDHITSFVPSPLIGPNDDRFGTRFPDMSQVYDLSYQQLIKTISARLCIDIKEGVYLQTTGPSYETPAEINMYRILGADAVGMSTTCEAMVARYLGMRIAGISCITNMASGMLKKELNHEEVKETANRIAESFAMLVKELIKEM